MSSIDQTNDLPEARELQCRATGHQLDGGALREAATRIGIFYDGHFFSLASNHYLYSHPRQSRLSISGLHEFVRARVAHEEHADARFCQIVEAHYFRGRVSADEARRADRLYAERVFDDMLIREGVTTHYLPIGYDGKEKGIDVWFALEAYELALQRRFDVCVLIACDSDFVPLARKITAQGVRVMVVGWDFQSAPIDGVQRPPTKTSQALLAEASYSVLLSVLIEDKSQKELVKQLFHIETNLLDSSPEILRGGLVGHGTQPPGSSDTPVAQSPGAPPLAEKSEETRHQGRVQNLLSKESRFGFITPDAGGPNLWFGATDVEGTSISLLSLGDPVSYQIGSNSHGPCARKVRKTA